jgi:hypothetical protein
MASSRRDSPSASGRLLRKAVDQPKPATDTFRYRNSRSPSRHASRPRPKPLARPCLACARLPRGSPSAPSDTRSAVASGPSRTSRTVGLASCPAPLVPKHPGLETLGPAGPSTSTTRLPAPLGPKPSVRRSPRGSIPWATLRLAPLPRPCRSTVDSGARVVSPILRPRPAHAPPRPDRSPCAARPVPAVPSSDAPAFPCRSTAPKRGFAARSCRLAGAATSTVSSPLLPASRSPLSGEVRCGRSCQRRTRLPRGRCPAEARPRLRFHRSAGLTTSAAPRLADARAEARVPRVDALPTCQATCQHSRAAPACRSLLARALSCRPAGPATSTVGSPLLPVGRNPLSGEVRLRSLHPATSCPSPVPCRTEVRPDLRVRSARRSRDPALPRQPRRPCRSTCAVTAVAGAPSSDPRASP